mmetsp:Transcript_1991/g.3011  ORF Transcript_1991/g.3011 Transcript_1991/m.3011 type:complete len:97 (-) Transcript_1991:355-645(-)
MILAGMIGIGTVIVIVTVIVLMNEVVTDTMTVIVTVVVSAIVVVIVAEKGVTMTKTIMIAADEARMTIMKSTIDATDRRGGSIADEIHPDTTVTDS